MNAIISTLIGAIRDRFQPVYLQVRTLLPLNVQRGQGMVEYALVLILIAVVVLVVLIVLGNKVKNVFCNISSGLGA